VYIEAAVMLLNVIAIHLLNENDNIESLVDNVVKLFISSSSDTNNSASSSSQLLVFIVLSIFRGVRSRYLNLREKEGPSCYDT
jgi:hypothetical protein